MSDTTRYDTNTRTERPTHQHTILPTCCWNILSFIRESFLLSTQPHAPPTTYSVCIGMHSFQEPTQHKHHGNDDGFNGIGKAACRFCVLFFGCIATAFYLHHFSKPSSEPLYMARPHLSLLLLLDLRVKEEEEEAADDVTMCAKVLFVKDQQS